MGKVKILSYAALLVIPAASFFAGYWAGYHMSPSAKDVLGAEYRSALTPEQQESARQKYGTVTGGTLAFLSSAAIVYVKFGRHKKRW